MTSPTNQVLNMVCCWLENPNSQTFKRHIPRIKDYLWVAEDGMKMQVILDFLSFFQQYGIKFL